MKPFFVLFLLAVAPVVFAQSGANPFELTDRLPDSVALGENAPVRSGNPFDVYRSGGAARATTPAPATAPNFNAPLVVQPTDPEQGKGAVLAIHLLLLMLLAVIWMLFRDLLRQCLAGTVNDGIMTQLYRRRSGGQLSALWMCYLFFYLAAGYYLYFFMTYHGISLLRMGVWESWLIYTLVVSTLVGLKHVVLFAFARVFPVRRDVSRYAFVLMIFSILAGLAIVPINLLVSYAPEEWRPVFLYGGLLVLSAIYLLHLLRGLFIAAPYLSSRPAHILLYICTIEIAPLLLIYRYLSDSLA